MNGRFVSKDYHPTFLFCCGVRMPIAEDPLCSVVLGTGKILRDFKFLRRILIE